MLLPTIACVRDVAEQANRVPPMRRNQVRGANKARRRKTTGTGRCRYLKTMPRRFKNGFKSGTEAKRMTAKVE